MSMLLKLFQIQRNPAIHNVVEGEKWNISFLVILFLRYCSLTACGGSSIENTAAETQTAQAQELTQNSIPNSIVITTDNLHQVAQLAVLEGPLDLGAQSGLVSKWKIAG